MLVCLLFVLGTMIEFALNLLLSRILEEKKKESELKSYDKVNESNKERSLRLSIHGSEKLELFGDNNSNQNCLQSMIKKLKQLKQKSPFGNAKFRMTSKIDMISFIAFTFSFFVFNLVYYIALL